MDSQADPGGAPFRDPRYAPRALEVERRADGSTVLRNPRAYETRWTRTFDALAHWAAAAPERDWLLERSGTGMRALTYAEGAAQARAAAGGLLGLGVEPGRSLLILARNGVDHAVVAYGAMSVGIVAAPVSPQYGLAGADLGRLAHAIDLLRPAAVYVDDAAAFGAALDLPGLSSLPVIASRDARPGDIAIEALLRSDAAPEAALAAVTGDRAAKHLLTSGSTGRPKAVICTQANIALNGAQIAACLDDPDPPVSVNSAPWSHSLGGNALLHGITHRGGTLAIDRGRPVAGGFEETLGWLREISPTSHNMVPAGWALLADALERDDALARTFFARVRIVQYGGAGLAQSIADRVAAVALRTVGERITFAAGYGATETGPTACTVHWLNDRMGTVGLPVPGTAVKLVPVGAKSELRVRGPQVSPGYLDAPELTAAAFDEEGYYRLGDAAALVDPDLPEAGLRFDGRLSEDFKLSTGTWVSAGALRVAAVNAIGGSVMEAVVCGEGREGVGLLLFRHPGWDGEGAPAAVRAGLERLNAAARGGAGRVARALLLDGAPDAATGELTDKGYLNQAIARDRRTAEVARLFSAEPDPDVVVLS